MDSWNLRDASISSVLLPQQQKSCAGSLRPSCPTGKGKIHSIVSRHHMQPPKKKADGETGEPISIFTLNHFQLIILVRQICGF
jgi:hypothetical protein